MTTDRKSSVTGSAGFLHRFVECRRANIAMSFGLVAIPLLISAGAAVDLSRALIVRQRLSHALDAAGLAVGRTVGFTEEQMNTLATDFFNANYTASELGTPSPVNVSLDGTKITLSATAELNTAIMRIVGVNHLTVGAVSEITKLSRGLELMLVLDTTGSMAQDSPSKITSLKNAGQELLDILFGDSNYPELLKVGVVPFAAAVRVDPTTAVNNGWIDTNGTNSFAQLNFTGGKYAYWLYTDSGGLSNTEWTGCVEARPNQLDETDTPPSSGSPDTRWVPMFYPDEPHVNEPENSSWNSAASNQSGISSNYSSDYITNYASVSSINTSTDRLTANSHGLVTGDGPVRYTTTSTMMTVSGITNPGRTDFWIIRVDNNTVRLATSRANALSGTAINITASGSGTRRIVESWGDASTQNQGTSLAHQTHRQQEWQKYIGKSYSGTDGPLNGCGMQPITPLTNDKTVLQAAINALNPSGNTHIPLGLGWGWQFLSGKLPGTQAVPYSNENYIKAIVLMTDGDNTKGNVNNTLNRSDYSAYGYATQARMGSGVDTSSEMASEMDESLTRTCNNIKNIKDSDNNDRIRIYTIAFGTGVPNATKDLLEDCATQPEFFFYSPSGSALEQAFQTIATDLSNLRISR